MGAPKTPKINELEYNGRTSNKKDAGQKKIVGILGYEVNHQQIL